VLIVSSENGSESSKIFLTRFFSRSIAIFLLVLPLIASVAYVELMQRSDFLLTFYIAGRMVIEGRALELYPAPGATTLLTTSFNSFAHHLFPKLPELTTAIYMYPPLTAVLFAPLGYLPPVASIVVWQILSMLSLGVCAFLYSSIAGKKWQDYFFNSVLFLPIFHTILIGHLGIVLGLLPVAVGYWCLIQGKPGWAGLIWSLLLLKPQFLPLVLLVIGSLFLIGRFRAALAFSIGALCLIIIAVGCLGQEVAHNWLGALKLSDQIFSDPRYGYPHYLVCSLPAAVLQTLPYGLRAGAKLILYGLAVAISAHALWLARKLCKKAAGEYLQAVPIVFALGGLVLPLVLPHYLFYDLSVLALVGMVIHGNKHLADPFLRRDLLLAWLFVDAYLILFMFIKSQLAQPLALVAVLVILYYRMVKVSYARVADETVTGATS
jgi:hypothetical protein